MTKDLKLHDLEKWLEDRGYFIKDWSYDHDEKLKFHKLNLFIVSKNSPFLVKDKETLYKFEEEKEQILL